MNNLYRRPMFRKGGSAGGGITSGLQSPRQGYNTNEDNTVKQNDLSKVDLRDMNMQQIKDLASQMAYKAPPMPANRARNDFLIDFGLDLASRPSSGSGFGGLLTTAAQSAKEPFKNFKSSSAAYNKSINERSANKYNSESDLFSTLLGAQSKILGGESGSSYKDLEIAKKLRQIMPRFVELKQKRAELITTGQQLNKEDDLELKLLQEDYNRFSAKNLEDDLLMEIYAKSLGDRAIPKRAKELYTTDLGKGTDRKYTGQDDPQIKKDAIQSIRLELQGIRTYAEGGRTGYANGELVEEQITETETMAPGPMDDGANNLISYDQMRARLPNEVTDDIIELMVNSAEALEDFAMISSQQEVDQFNKKYSVNLVLPAEA